MTDAVRALMNRLYKDGGAEPMRTSMEYEEVEAALRDLANPTTPAPVAGEGLRRAVEEVDGAWHDEGDHIEYHEELAERLIALRAALSEPVALPTDDHKKGAGK